MGHPAKAFGRTMEVLRKILHRVDVGTYGALRVVATLEFVRITVMRVEPENTMCV